jgi:hypothetical protein
MQSVAAVTESVRPTMEAVTSRQSITANNSAIEETTNGKVSLPPNENDDKLKDHLLRLDRILHNFSDGASCIRPGRMDLWSRNNRTKQDIAKVYAPAGLEKQFQELYTMLHPCLVQRDGKDNASAFLQGTRGSGKSLLLNQCLQAFHDELSMQKERKPLFRIVKLNGIIIPGDNVGIVVKEILRQLSTAAFQQTDRDPIATTTCTDDDSSTIQGPMKRPKTKSSERTEKLLRLRQTSFTNNLQLLNEILQLACVDNIPVLFVLDELDAFLGSSGSSLQEDTRSAVMAENVGKDRQLLLYHLLDRVATQGSFICFVGVTSHQGIMGMLEKRIRSRAEGTSRFIHFGPCPSFSALLSLLLSKFDASDDDSPDQDASRNSQASLHQQVSQILTRPTQDSDTVESRVFNALQRDYRLGKGIRWFSRVFSMALSIYREDCRTQMKKARLPTTPGDSGNCNAPPPMFHVQYLFDALMDMGSSLLTETGDRDLVLVDGVAVDPRIQALKDLSGPQVALILSARRVLARDSIREDTTTPLTLDRILEEYRTYQGSSNRYGGHVLSKSFQDLVEMNFFRPAADHSGGGPLQYNHDPSNCPVDLNTTGRVPIHLTVDIHRELRKALEKNLLDCSTALREWGRKTN